MSNNLVLNSSDLDTDEQPAHTEQPPSESLSDRHSIDDSSPRATEHTSIANDRVFDMISLHNALVQSVRQKEQFMENVGDDLDPRLILRNHSLDPR